MLVAARMAVSHCAGKSKEELRDDYAGQCLLVRAFEILGKAASTISRDLWSRFPEIPWRTLVDMRNILVHVYFDIDDDILRLAATDRLPTLIAQLESPLAQEMDSEKD